MPGDQALYLLVGQRLALGFRAAGRVVSVQRWERVSQNRTVGNRYLRPMDEPSRPRSVLVAGATGLVGQEILDLLRDDRNVGRIVVISRRSMEGENSPKVESHLVDFDNLERHAELFAVDQIFCALGTTIKKAGSEAAFRHVDYDFPVAIAQLGRDRGATHFLLVSAIGASARSRFFYNRVKGELEDVIRTLGYRTVTIVRPSLLVGKRDEFRLGEQIAMRFADVVPKKYRPVEARDVAAALVESARDDSPGFHIIESSEIRHVAAGEQERQPRTDQP